VKSLKIALLLSVAIILSSGTSWGWPKNLQSTFSLSQAVKSLYLTPNGRYLFDLSSSSTSLTIFDTLLFSEVSTYSVGYVPYDMVISSDGLKAYLASSRADSIIVLDISDPEAITQSEVLTLSTTSVSFSRIASATVSGKLYLFLTDEANNRVYIYNATDKVQVSSSNNPVNLTFTPTDIEVSPDGATFSVMSTDGHFQIFSTSTFDATISALDVGAYSSSTLNFTKLALASVPSYGEVAFLLNSNALGEVFLIDMRSKLTSIAFIDADPTGGTAQDPILAGNGASDIKLMTVSTPQSGESTALYLYTPLSVDLSVKVTDMKGIPDGIKVEPFTTISSVGSVLAGGTVSSSSDGYIYFGANDSQAIKVVSENPVITVVSPTSDPTITTGSLDITFKSDVSGTFTVTNYTGSPQDNLASTVGTALETGSVTAGVETTVSVSVNELTEGENFIGIFVSASNLVGREGIKITYDIVPSVPGHFKVEFGDSKLYVSFDRQTASDMDHYNIYFGTASDNLTGADGIASPIQVAQPLSGGSVNYTISPLTNGVEIFVQVSAVDKGGNEGDRTEIVSNIPEATIGPLGLSGETGGCGFVNRDGNFNPGLLIFLATFILAGLFLKSRSRYLALIFFCLLFLQGYASAQETQDEPKQITIDQPADDDSGEPKIPINPPMEKITIKLHDRMSSTFRVSWFMPSSNVLDGFFGDKGNEMYGIKTTYFIWNFEIGLEADFLMENAKLIGISSGRQSGEKAKLIMVPITFPLYFNLRFTSEQLFVPYGKIGYTLLYFRISEPTDTVNGVTNNIVFGGGLKFNFERISGTEGGMREFGMNHMFLFFEWDYTKNFHDDPGLDFSGHNWGFGVGVDY
jgi:hypothetical protein